LLLAEQADQELAASRLAGAKIVPPPFPWTAATPSQIDLATDGLRGYRVALPSGRAGPLPVLVMRNGPGPAVLLTGGTHGDEFEGQIVVGDIVRGTDLADVSGLIIALPLHNYPACLSGTRCGPSDDADLNRLFNVATAQSGETATIAEFVSATLLPPVDWVIDLHSGGRAHEFVLSANLQARPGSPEYADMLPALLAFDAPYGLLFDEVGGANMPHAGTLEGLARQLGKRAISSELGGGGRATPLSLAAARQGLRNLLAHIGARHDANATPPQQSRSRLIALSRAEQYVGAPSAGRFAPQRWLEDEVRAGEVLGHIHPLDDPMAEPEAIVARSDGLIAAVASAGVQRAGAALFFVAERLSLPPINSRR
jgi:N2-acetyl-L-2,4-diaminobutanoate deacetylase